MNRPTKPCPYGCRWPVLLYNDLWHVCTDAKGIPTISQGCPEGDPEDDLFEEIEAYD